MDGVSTVFYCRTRLFLPFLLLIFLILPGCNNENPKKVSLYKKETVDTGKIGQAKQNTIWFGFDLRLGPKDEVRIYTPFLKYLENATGKRFRIKFTEKYEDTVANLGKGITHFAAIGTLSYVTGANKYGIKYLVSGVNNEGDPLYHSMIFTRPDSGINNIRDIKGRCFAFGSTMSTQGHLIPRKMLDNEGIDLNGLSKYIYTGSHLNAVKAVLNNECDAGGIQDVLAKRLAKEGKIKIIHTSEPYPSSVIAYNDKVDPEIVEAVRSALLAFDPANKHKHLLYGWDRTEMPLGFSEINDRSLNRVSLLAREYGFIKE